MRHRKYVINCLFNYLFTCYVDYIYLPIIKNLQLNSDFLYLTYRHDYDYKVKIF